MDIKKILNDVLALLPFNGSKTKYSAYVAVIGGALILAAKPDVVVLQQVLSLLNSLTAEDLVTAGVVGAAVGGAHKVVKE